jgi:hypothetical protein
MARGVGNGSAARVCPPCDAGERQPKGVVPAVRHQPDVGYKLLARQQAGDAELADRSRRARAAASGGGFLGPGRASLIS